MTCDRSSKPPRSGGSIGLSRRTFLWSAGVGTMAVAVRPGGVSAAAPAREETDTVQSLSAEEKVPITLQVNGRQEKVLVEPRWSLLYVLREQLGLTAAKIGCERGECGACSVLIDDVPRYACMTLAVEAEDRRIETAEGLLDGNELGAVQQSFVQEDGLQCGYCTPGQVIAAEGLLRKNPNPSFEEIRLAMSGNLCRCGAYDHIFKAVAAAAQQRGAG